MNELKVIKIKSYEDELRERIEEQQRIEQDLLSLSNIQESKIRTYNSRKEYHRHKNIQRITQLLDEVKSKLDYVKVKEYEKELKELESKYKREDRKILLNEIWINIKKLFR